MATKTTAELSTAELLGRRFDLAKEIGQHGEIVESLRKQNRIHVKGSEIKWQEHALGKYESGNKGSSSYRLRTWFPSLFHGCLRVNQHPILLPMLITNTMKQ